MILLQDKVQVVKKVEIVGLYSPKDFGLTLAELSSIKMLKNDPLLLQSQMTNGSKSGSKRVGRKIGEHKQIGVLLCIKGQVLDYYKCLSFFLGQIIYYFM